MTSGDQPRTEAIPFISVSSTVMNAMVSDVGTVVYNVTTSKLNLCVSKSAGAGSWKEITSAA